MLAPSLSPGQRAALLSGSGLFGFYDDFFCPPEEGAGPAADAPGARGDQQPAAICPPSPALQLDQGSGSGFSSSLLQLCSSSMQSSAVVDPPIPPSLAWRRLSEAEDPWVELLPPSSTAIEEQPPARHPLPVASPGEVSNNNSSTPPESDQGEIFKSRAKQFPNQSYETPERKTSTPSVVSLSPTSSEKGEPTSSRRRTKYRTSPSPDRLRRNARSPSRKLRRQTDDVSNERNKVPYDGRRTELTSVCSECGRRLPCSYDQHYSDVPESSEVAGKQRDLPSDRTEATTVSGDCPECGRSLPSQPYGDSIRSPQSSEVSRPSKRQECPVTAKIESRDTKQLPYAQKKSSGYTRKNKGQQSRPHSPPTLCIQCREQLSSCAAEYAERTAEHRSFQALKAANNAGNHLQTTSPCIPCRKAASPEIFESKGLHAPQMTKEMIYDLLSTPYEPLCLAYYTNTPRERSTFSDASTPQQQSEYNATAELLRELHESEQDSQRESLRSCQYTQEGGHSGHRPWSSDIRYLPQKLVAETNKNNSVHQPPSIIERNCMPKMTYQNHVSQPSNPNRRDCMERPADAKTNVWFPEATYNEKLDLHHKVQPIHNNPLQQNTVFSTDLLMEHRAYDSAAGTFAAAQDNRIPSPERNGRYSSFPPSPSASTRAHHASGDTYARCSQPSPLWGHRAPHQMDASAPPLLPGAPPTVVHKPPVKLSDGLARYADPPADMWLQFSSVSDSSDASSFSDQIWIQTQSVLHM